MLYKSVFYFLISLILIILIYIMSYYYLNTTKKNPIYKKEDKVLLKSANPQKEEKNFIENIAYISTDVNGNKYEIKSESGYFDKKNEDLIIMNNVSAYILLKNKKKNFITSKKAIYNNKTNDTKFLENIKVSYIHHKMLCEELNFMFTKNLMSLKENIVYQNGYESFFADTMEINLITKETKIFMDDDISKVKFLKKNGYN